MYIDLVCCDLAKFTVNSDRGIPWDLCRFLDVLHRQSCYLWMKTAFLLPSLHAFPPFSCLTPLSSVSDPVWKRSAERGHPGLAPDLRGKVLSLSPNMTSAVGVCSCPLLGWGRSFLNLLCLELFFMNECWVLSSAFFVLQGRFKQMMFSFNKPSYSQDHIRCQKVNWGTLNFEDFICANDLNWAAKTKNG